MMKELESSSAYQVFRARVERARDDDTVLKPESSFYSKANGYAYENGYGRDRDRSSGSRWNQPRRGASPPQYTLPSPNAPIAQQRAPAVESNSRINVASPTNPPTSQPTSNKPRPPSTSESSPVRRFSVQFRQVVEGGYSGDGSLKSLLAVAVSKKILKTQGPASVKSGRGTTVGRPERAPVGLDNITEEDRENEEEVLMR